MSSIIRKLTSRKLWVAIAGISTGITMILGGSGDDISNVAGAVTTLVSVAMYIYTEGKIDMEGVKNTLYQIDEAIDCLEDTNTTNKVGFSFEP